MTSKRTQEALAKLGFAYDETVTGRDPVWGYWNGTIDPIGKMSINGECRGIVVGGDTRKDMDTEAIVEAEFATRLLQPCTDPDCDMHKEE